MKRKIIYFLATLVLLFSLVACHNDYSFTITAPQELYVGDTYELKATTNVVWSVSDEEILKLEGSKITALKAGTVTVYAKNAKKESVEVSAGITVLEKVIENEKYEITYVLNGGELPTNAPVVYEENVGLSSLPTPSKEGYTFLGWYMNEELVTSIASTQKGKITLEARFSKNIVEYEITYDTDGGVISDSYEETYTSEEGIDKLPIPTKENYAFIGWFLSDISLYKYEKIDKGTSGDLHFVARWVKLTNENEISLPDATFHFTNIKKTPHSSGNGTYVYQPDFSGLSVPSTSVLKYTWTTSDANIASISTYSSITAKNSGYCVITATYVDDPSITINTIIKVTSEGVFYATEEEANEYKVYTVTYVGAENEVLSTQKVVSGGFAYPPTPKEYAGKKFIGWDKDNYNITSDLTIKAKYTDGENKYVGKKFAILGDSISTYDGYIPNDYKFFYPYPTADVNDVNHTWWMQAINTIGAGLFVNNSYSGSTVATDASSATQSDSRLATLLVDGQAPDVIIIYMGSNDCASPYVSLEDFTKAYKVMLDKIKVLCPDAEIILCTLPVSELYAEADRLQYNEVIEDYAQEYALEVIPLSDVDITSDLVDSAHPYRSGMTKISKKVVETLIGEVDIPELNVSVENEEVIIGSSTKLNVTVKNLEGDVKFASSDENIATVNSEGVITALAVGKVTITVSCGDMVTTVDIVCKEFSVEVTYKFEGGYSSELYIANKGDAPSLKINNYNYNDGTFWGGKYTSDIFIGDSSHDPKATFSDRIYIAKNVENAMYEVVNILRSGASSWPEGAQYVISISNSYNNYYAAINPITKQINVGDTVVFSRDFTTMSNSNPGEVYFFDSVPSGDTVVTEVSKSSSLIVPGYLGYKFLGWYDADGKLYDDVSDITGDVTLYAKWEELNPVTSIKVDAICDEMETNETFQIIASVLPEDAYFKQIFFTSSNTDILTVSSSGVITAINTGAATITITDYLQKVTYQKEIIVNAVDSIDVTFEDKYLGYIEVGETLQLDPKAYGKGRSGTTFTYEVSDASILSVSSSGLVTALKNGTSDVIISSSDNSLSVTLTISVQTYATEKAIDKLLALLVNNHYARVSVGNISLYNDGREKVFVSTYGSVNNYLFDAFKVDTTYYATTENNPNNHMSRRSTDQIEFVTVHDTATLTGTVVSIAQGMSSGETSIHYTVGNDAIYGVVPEKYIAYHAGDGTGTAFTWTKTTVVASSNVAPKFGIIKDGNNYYLTVNGTKTTVSVPTINGGVPTEEYLTHLGPTWKVENGVYYIGGPLWYSSSYNSIGSRGGNNNSIGIEMCSNLSGDIYDTFQRTAKLVADILLRNNLDTTRVKMHNTWSGKNCPQTMIEGSFWDTFMQMVELEYEIQKNYSNAKISIVSNNPTIIDNTGRVINAPLVTTSVSYKLTIELGEEIREVTLYSVIPGTTTWEKWDGTYSASRVWNNGVYAK